MSLTGKDATIFMYVLYLTVKPKVAYGPNRGR